LSNHIIVDGHNYIFQTGGNHLRQSREKLLFALVEYRRKKNVEITVVFDNRSQETLGNEKSHFHGIVVMYGAPKIDADDIINDIVERAENKKRVIVVTTDKTDIGRYCKRLGAKVIDPHELKKLMDKSRMPSEMRKKVDDQDSSDKPKFATNAEIEYYLKKFSGK